MGQTTIYLDDHTAKRVEEAARAAGASVSSWIRSKLDEAIKRAWPPGYFDVFGSLENTDLERPPQPDVRDQAGREPL